MMIIDRLFETPPTLKQVADEIGSALQGKASDLSTLLVMIPALALALIFSLRKSIKAQLVLIGSLAYFLYTYMSYTFLWMYNSFFLIYTAIMSLSFFALFLCIMELDIQRLPDLFKKDTPTNLFGIFQITLGMMVGILWLGKIIPTILTGNPPVGLDHYSTLVIQGMDIGFVIPIAIISGVLMIKKKPWGYLLSSVVIIKAEALLLSITMMIINMAFHGEKVSLIEISVFSILDVMMTGLIIALMRCVKNQPEKII